MSLRDDLARRLQVVGLRESVWTGSFEHWEWLADECIRQMEWARTQCVGEQWEGDADDRHVVDRSQLGMTLAPSDWRPE